MGKEGRGLTKSDLRSVCARPAAAVVTKHYRKPLLSAGSYAMSHPTAVTIGRANSHHSVSSCGQLGAARE